MSEVISNTPLYIPSPHPYRGEGYSMRGADSHLIVYPDGDLIERHLSTASAFCRAVVNMGYLTQQQMEHAAERYLLGMSRDGGVIFWQLGSAGKLYDGKIMYYRNDCHRDHNHKPTWVMSELKKFYLADFPELAAGLPSVHSLFGTHLLGDCKSPYQDSRITNPREQSGVVAVVEAEKTAFIMSEIYPDYLWLAAGGLNELTASKLFALKGRKIILFPDTDEQHKAYDTWYKVSKEAQFLLWQPIHLSPILEQNATPDQKRRKIDIVDYYFETIKPRLSPRKS